MEKIGFSYNPERSEGSLLPLKIIGLTNKFFLVIVISHPLRGIRDCSKRLLLLLSPW